MHWTLRESQRSEHNVFFFFPANSLPFRIFENKEKSRSIILTNTEADPKVMHPILLCWTTMLEVYVGHIAGEAEPSCQ